MDYNILHLTDIHGAGQNIASISNELRKADLVILSGDITHFGYSKDVVPIIENIANFNKNIYAIPGNCDTMR